MIQPVGSSVGSLGSTRKDESAKVKDESPVDDVDGFDEGEEGNQVKGEPRTRWDELRQKLVTIKRINFDLLDQFVNKTMVNIEWNIFNISSQQIIFFIIIIIT